MRCDLDKYTTYNLSNVKKDVSDSRLVVKLDSPPSSCPEGVFTSKKAYLKVVPGISSPTLTFDTSRNAPVISVKSMKYVEEINIPESGIGTVLLWILGITAVGYGIYRLIKHLNKKEEQTETYLAATGTDGIASRRYSRIPNTSSAPTTIVNNNSGGSGNGFVTGMMFNELMHTHDHSGGYSHHDDSDNSAHTHSRPDSGSSYSSDDSSSSGSSYSSDSSSYSSDSGSSYSSDSGSYSSDSGGGSFSSD